MAVWNPDDEWIEMRLRSVRAHTATLGALDLVVEFAEGEQVRTEISVKFREEGVRSELAAARLELRHWWTDDDADFAVSLSFKG